MHPTPISTLLQTSTVMNARRLLLLLSISASVFSSRAQTSKADPKDLQGWMQASLGLNLPKRWDASLDLQYRRQGDMGTFMGAYVAPSVGYGLTKNLRVFANYRYVRTSEAWSSRVGIGVELTAKKSGWNLGFRPQLQHTLRYADDGDGSASAKTLLRTRLQARHALTKRLDGYFSVEPYLNFDPSEYIVDNIRNTIGLRYEYAKGRKLGLFYIYRPDYSKRYNRVFHVVGLRWDLDWKVGG
jgi:hypothetical protein